MRQSLVSRRRAESRTLIRIVLDPDGRPVVDLGGRLPGRGAHVEPSELYDGLTGKGLARAFKGGAHPLPHEVALLAIAQAKTQLEARLIALLGLTRRAGALELGMDGTVRMFSQLGPDERAFVWLAGDLSERSTDVVRDVTKGMAVTIAVGSTLDALGVALGHRAVGIVATREPRWVEALAIEWERLTGLQLGERQGPTERTGQDAARRRKGKGLDPPLKGMTTDGEEART